MCMNFMDLNYYFFITCINFQFTPTSFVPIFYFVVDPKDPSIEYEWFDVGMLTYDPETDRYLVQKTDLHGRILDAGGNVVVNGGNNGKGKYQ